MRISGAIRIHMRGPDGTVYPMTGVYQEIVEPERLVFTRAALDEEGKPLFEVLNHRDLRRAGGQTTRNATGWSRSLGAVEGLTQALDRLEDYLARM